MAPGCRRAARKVQQDHIHAHAHGGPTLRANLGPLCARHHRMKHYGGWRLTQYRPGHFRWQSPLRATYYTRGDPVAVDLPHPLPGPVVEDEADRR